MSNLYRSAISARIAKLPSDIHVDSDEDEESEDGLGDLPGRGMGPPPMPRRTPLQPKKRTPNLAYTPISASTFFSQALQVAVPSRELDFRVYYTPSSTRTGTVMVCHHGAGYSGLSFACMAKEIADLTKGELGVLALDARRHGKTKSTVLPEPVDLSINVLVQDFVELIKTLFVDPAGAPSISLVGHSMGGAVVARSCPLLMQAGYKISGVTNLDIVEGSAIEALPFMNNLLNARPDGFGSVEDAIEWHVHTKAIRNSTSARVSIPSIITPNPEGEGAEPAYLWRTPLRSTADYWRGWFTGLSSLFLSVRTARLLILAGTDRLDRELMIGQMQGKFQMEVVVGVGHLLQEDDPTRLAEILIEFWRRNERVDVRGLGIKKVGEV